MALTFQLADTDGNLLSESYAILDDELLDYLASLDGFPVLRSFRGVDPADETFVDEEVRGALAAEAEELERRAERREGPAPPGHGGLGDILRRISYLLHLARTLGAEVWLLGDESQL